MSDKRKRRKKVFYYETGNKSSVFVCRLESALEPSLYKFSTLLYVDDLDFFRDFTLEAEEEETI